MSNEAKQIVQAGLDKRRAERQFHAQDMEAIGVVRRKQEIQHQQATEAMNQAMQARAAEIEARKAEIKAQQAEEEAQLEEEAECRKDLRQGAMIGGVLCAIGGLYFLGQFIPDVGWTMGGLFAAAGLTVVGGALARWRWSQW